MTRISREQVRAVFLTALMIGSVFGAGVAFTGTAAAGSLGVTLADNDVDELTTYTADYTVEGYSGSVDEIEFDTKAQSTSSVSASDVTLTVAGEEVEITSGEFGQSGGVITLTLSESVSVEGGDSITLEADNVKTPASASEPVASVTVRNGGTDVDSAQASYSVVDSVPALSQFDASIDNGEVNVSFVSNQTLDNSGDNIQVDMNIDGGTEVTIGTSGTNFDDTFTEETLDSGDKLYYATWDAEADSATNGEYTAVLTTANDADDATTNAADNEEASVLVDTEGPVFEYVDPADGDRVTTTTPVIDFGLNDTLSSIDADSIEVTITDETDTVVVDGVNATEAQDDGIEYADGNLTIDPSADEIPEFSTGEHTIDVTVADSLGNTNDTSVSMFGGDGHQVVVDIGADFSFTIDNPVKEGDVVSDPTQSFDVTITEDSAADTVQSANITVSQDGTELYSTEESAAGTYTVDPSTFDAGELSNGTVTVYVNATDEEGEIAEQTFQFEVDNIQPNADSISLNESLVNNEVLSDGHDEVVTVDFDEEVQTSTIEAELRVDGTTFTLLDSSVASGSGVQEIGVSWTQDSADKTVYTASVDLSGTDDDGGTQILQSGTDNASVELEATAATDTYDVGSSGNSLDSTAESTFSVDNEAPTVAFESGFSGSTFADYVDLTNKLAAGEPTKTEGGEVSYYYKDTSAESPEFIEITDPTTVSATEIPDGKIDFKVNVTDDAGNTGSYVTSVDGSGTVTVDGVTPSVSTSFEDGQVVSNEVNLSEYFSTSGLSNEESVVYQIDTDGDGTFNETTSGDADNGTATLDEVFNAEGDTIDTTKLGYSDGTGNTTLSDGDTFEVSVNTTSDVQETNSMAVTLTVDHLNVTGISASEIDSTGNQQVTVSTDEQVDTLEVYLNSTDNFRDQTETVLTKSDFVESKDGSGYDYTYNVTNSEYRDGAFEAEFKSATNGSKVAYDDNDPSSAAFVVDNSTAEVVDADITDAGDGTTDVRITFDEPVDDTSYAIANDVMVDGTAVSVTGTSNTGNSDGVVNVTLGSNVQTGDAPDIEIPEGTVPEIHSIGGADDNGVTNETLSTIELSLDEGWNTVSIPAASGSIDASQLGDSVDVIWTYNASDESWDAYNPDDSTDSLSLEGGEGYLVKSSSSATVDLNVENQATTEQSTPTEQDISEGWNLVGHYQEGSQGQSDAFATMQTSQLSTTDEIVQNVYGQSTTGELVFDSYGSDLMPGAAYWVYVTDDTTYTESGWN